MKFTFKRLTSFLMAMVMIICMAGLTQAAGIPPQSEWEEIFFDDFNEVVTSTQAAAISYLINSYNWLVPSNGATTHKAVVENESGDVYVGVSGGGDAKRNFDPVTGDLLITADIMLPNSMVVNGNTQFVIKGKNSSGAEVDVAMLHFELSKQFVSEAEYENSGMYINTGWKDTFDKADVLNNAWHTFNFILNTSKKTYILYMGNLCLGQFNFKDTSAVSISQVYLVGPKNDNNIGCNVYIDNVGLYSLPSTELIYVDEIFDDNIIPWKWSPQGESYNNETTLLDINSGASPRGYTETDPISGNVFLSAKSTSATNSDKGVLARVLPAGVNGLIEIQYDMKFSPLANTWIQSGICVNSGNTAVGLIGFRRDGTNGYIENVLYQSNIMTVTPVDSENWEKWYTIKLILNPTTWTMDVSIDGKYMCQVPMNNSPMAVQSYSRFFAQAGNSVNNVVSIDNVLIRKLPVINSAGFYTPGENEDPDSAVKTLAQAAGKSLKLKVGIENNTDVGTPVFVAGALYDANNKIVSIAIGTTTPTVSGQGGYSTVETTEISVPAITTGHYVKAFIWSDSNDIRPLTAFTTFE